jgi:hypothetical protein
MFVKEWIPKYVNKYIWNLKKLMLAYVNFGYYTFPCMFNTVIITLSKTQI